ncbi:MAG TPA: aminotransferase class IV [Xanthobacteraceae bacterium]|jgi:branched-chain amino acid aminotransferase
MENGICYVNGSFVPASEAKVSIFDRGFTSGEGVYDVTRSFGHKLFRLDAHIARLYRSLKYTRIDCGMPIEEMTRLSAEVFERNKNLLAPDDDCTVWQVISRGVDRFARGRPVPATVTVFCVPIAYHTFAREYVEGAIVVTPSVRRTPPQSLEAKAKITNKVNHTMAAFEARQVNPRATPLLLDLDGNISETHLGNFFFVSGGKLHTSTERTVLGGVTRTTLLSMAGELGIPCLEGNFTPYDVYCADEAFTASTSPSIVPVRSLNGVAVGSAMPGPVTLRLMREWEKLVGIDFVSQALGHIEDRDKQSLLGQWAKLREGLLSRH